MQKEAKIKIRSKGKTCKLSVSGSIRSITKSQESIHEVDNAINIEIPLERLMSITGSIDLSNLKIINYLKVFNLLKENFIIKLLKHKRCENLK